MIAYFPCSIASSLILKFPTHVKAKRIRKLRKDMFQRKQKLKVLAENSDHLQDKLRRRDEKIKGLIDKNFKLTEKLKKDPDAHICIICFDSVSTALTSDRDAKTKKGRSGDRTETFWRNLGHGS